MIRTDFNDTAQALEHISFVPAVQQLLYLGRRHLLDRPPTGSCISSRLEREVACCHWLDSVPRNCIAMRVTCLQHARDTRYRLHVCCNRSRRNRACSSSNVWNRRGTRMFNLRRHRRASCFPPLGISSDPVMHLPLFTYVHLHLD